MKHLEHGYLYAEDGSSPSRPLLLWKWLKNLVRRR